MSNYLKLIFKSLLIAFISTAIISCGSDDDSPSNSDRNNSTEFSLFIETGAIITTQGDQVPLSAVTVDVNGETSSTSGVSWSVGDESVGIISNNIFQASGTGATFITASVMINDVEYTHSVPITVNARNGLFAVVPGAIIWDVEGGDIPLEAIYLGTGSPSFSFSSANSAIASVSSSGNVSFLSAGQTVITATCNADGNTYTQSIPVVVVGDISVPLPVTRVQVEPASSNLFLDQTVQLSAKAFNNSGEVTDQYPVIWQTLNDTIATVDANGLVSPKEFGRVTIQAIIEGVIGQAEIFVYPNKVIIVDPFQVSKGPGESQTFTAETYTVNRTTFLLEANPDANNPSGLQWWLPFNSIPFFPSLAEITSSDNNTATVKINDNAQALLPVIVEAFVNDPTIAAGGSVITVGTSFSGDCDCPPQDQDANSLNITSSTNVNLDLFMNFTSQINAEVLDASNNPLSSASIAYCSSNETVAIVDTDGLISAFGFGTAEITVCHGDLEETISVTVQ